MSSPILPTIPYSGPAKSVLSRLISGFLPISDRRDESRTDLDVGSALFGALGCEMGRREESFFRPRRSLSQIDKQSKDGRFTSNQKRTHMKKPALRARINALEAKVLGNSIIRFGSPSKANTLNRYLLNTRRRRPSFEHVAHDLPPP